MSADSLQPARGWADVPPRLLPQPPARQGWVFRSVSRVSRWFGRPQLPAVFPLLHHHPRLFWGWLGFAAQMMPWGRLPDLERELLILRTAWHCRSRYEWAQHVEIALRVGATDGDIVAVTGAPGDHPRAGMPLLLEACDQLLQDGILQQHTWTRLQQRFRDRELLELMMLVGHYRMLAAVLISTGLAVEPEMAAVLDALHQRLAQAPA